MAIIHYLFNWQSLAMVQHTSHHSTCEAEAGGARVQTDIPAKGTQVTESHAVGTAAESVPGVHKAPDVLNKQLIYNC